MKHKKNEGDENYVKQNDTVLAIKVKGVQLEQVKEYKYLWSLIVEDMRCIKEVKTRIGMAKTAFLELQRTPQKGCKVTTKTKNIRLLYQVSNLIWVRNMDFYQRNPGENQRLPALVLQTHVENQIL